MDIFKIEKHQVIFKSTCKITSPIAASRQLYYCVSENGDVFKLTSENVSSGGKKTSQVLFTILGCPSAIEIYDINRGFLIADLAHQSLFLRDDSEVQQIHNLITEFNDKAFHGPSSLAVNQASNYLFFTDSGPFGQTSLQNKVGSLFAYRFDDKSLRVLIHRQLAYPCGVILSQDQKYLLVCQLGENRIIKVILDENMNGNYTVFHQFSGRVGPSSICAYGDYYYVSLYEFAQLDSTGIIAVLNQDGDLIQKINLPTGPQISSIRFIQPGLQNDGQMIALITQGNRLHEICFRGDKTQQQLQQQNGLESSTHKK